MKQNNVTAADNMIPENFVTIIILSNGIWVYSRVVNPDLGRIQLRQLLPYQYLSEILQPPGIGILALLDPDQGRNGRTNSNGNIGICRPDYAG